MGELRFTFNPEKAGQAAAYLLKRSGGELSKGKLVKMLYAGDWSHLRQTGKPITGDSPVAMPHGPVLSATLNLLTGEKSHKFWSAHISSAPRGAHNVCLKKDAPDDLLSESEKRALDRVHDFLGSKSWPEVRKFSHEFFTEWSDPGSTCNPIAFEDMLLKSGQKKQKFIDELIADQKEKAHLDSIFA